MRTLKVICGKFGDGPLNDANALEIKSVKYVVGDVSNSTLTILTRLSHHYWVLPPGTIILENSLTGNCSHYVRVATKPKAKKKTGFDGKQKRD